MVRGNEGGQTHSAPPPVHSPSAVPAVPPSMPHAVRPDDDEFVAIAISPRPPRYFPRRHRIRDMLVGAGVFHGCIGVAVGVGNNAHDWASGSGVIATLRATAVGRLGGSANFVCAQCSDPPGILRAPVAVPSSAPTTPSRPTIAHAAAVGQTCDPTGKSSPMRPTDQCSLAPRSVGGFKQPDGPGSRKSARRVPELVAPGP